MGAKTFVTIGKLWLPISCLVLAMYFIRIPPEVSGDGRLAFAYAVIDHHTIAVDPYVSERPLIEQDLAVFNGHEYMAKPPLPAILATMAYAALRIVFAPAHMNDWLWKWALTVLVSGIAFVVTIMLVERLASDARLHSPRLAGLATAVATPLLVYATFLTADSVAAALLVGAAFAAVRGRGLLVGALVGALLSTDTVAATGATGALALVGFDALRSRSLAKAVSVALGLGIGVVPLLAYQAAAFGSPFASMYTYLTDPQQRAAYADLRIGLPTPDTVIALLASPRNGLFTVAPIALIGSALLVRLWRDTTNRRLLVSTGGGAAAAILAFAALPHDLVFWPDRAEYGPRLLVPLLPLLCWPLGALSARVLASATFVGAIPQVVAVAIWQPMLNPGATYQVGEVFRRFVGDVTPPSIAGLGLPQVLPERMRVAQVAFVIGVLASLARSALVGMRAPRTA